MALGNVGLVLTAAAATCFIVATVVAQRALFCGRGGREAVVMAWTAAGALLLAVTLVWRGVHGARLPGFGPFAAPGWYSLALAGGYVFLARKHAVHGLGAIVAPLLVLVTILALPRAAGAAAVEAPAGGLWLNLHVATAFVGYGLFTIESVLAAVYLVQDRNLKRKQLGRLFQRLPSLSKLDLLMQELIGTAFLAFTVSLGAGIVLTYLNRWSGRWVTDPKIVATASTWLVYAVLFRLRTAGRRRGREMAVVALVGLACVLFSFLGVHLVADSLHDFGSAASGGAG